MVSFSNCKPPWNIKSINTLCRSYHLIIAEIIVQYNLFILLVVHTLLFHFHEKLRRKLFKLQALNIKSVNILCYYDLII